MPLLRVIYHSIRLVQRILIRLFSTPANIWSLRSPYFSSTESCSYAPASSPTLFDFPRSVDSNHTLVNPIRPLAVKLLQLSTCFLRVLVKDLSLLPAPHTASSPMISFFQPVYRFFQSLNKAILLSDLLVTRSLCEMSY